MIYNLQFKIATDYQIHERKKTSKRYTHIKKESGKRLNLLFLFLVTRQKGLEGLTPWAIITTR
jgi:hypothetical protein